VNPKRITPIFNVSNIEESFAWFEKLGWEKAWAWGDPRTLVVCARGRFEIFLCEGAQGSRGKSELTQTFGPTTTTPPTRGDGCRSGWTMWTRSTNGASIRVSK
jgi:hypothetical protein